jgi:hypothetical protein
MLVEMKALMLKLGQPKAETLSNDTKWCAVSERKLTLSQSTQIVINADCNYSLNYKEIFFKLKSDFISYFQYFISHKMTKICFMCNERDIA